MKSFTLTKKHLKDEDLKAEVEACVEAMMLLKDTEQYNTTALLTLLTAYLQLPKDDIDPEGKDEIAEVSAALGRVFESVRRTGFLIIK